ncbi:MAG: hypothetical protein ACKO14_04160 [Armatimonadota bacterium]
MKSTYRERLDRVIGMQSTRSGVALLESNNHEPSEMVYKVLVDALLDSCTTEVVLVVDESESMRVVASTPTAQSEKLSTVRLIADLANFLCLRRLNNCKVIRIGASGSSGNRVEALQSNAPRYQAFGKTPKSEKTAYLLRRALTRMSGDAHLIVVSDFRSFMWRRNLSALQTTGPRVTLVHLVDEADCDFVMSSDDRLDLAIEPDPSPWRTPLIDSVIPPSDIHAYLTTYSEVNDISLLGIVVQENTLEDIMCNFERAIVHA